MAEAIPNLEADPNVYDEVMRSLEKHPMMSALKETQASEEVIRAAAHVIVDSAIDQASERKARSDHLKRSAGKFGSSEYIKFVDDEQTNTRTAGPVSIESADERWMH